MFHKIIKGIVEHQRDYFASNSELNLKPLTRAELARFVSNSRGDSRNLDFVIDASRISRVIRELSLITPRGEEIPLRLFFANRRDMVKRRIKAILNQEKKDIGSGQITKQYTDEELRYRINEEYGVLVTRREVAYCRKELGILSYVERNGYVYHTLAANFSQVYPLTAPSVESNAPVSPGVYELCLASGGIGYPAGSCQTFYIGSARNLRKRLLSHLSSSSRNGGIRRFIKEKSCVFRYLPVAQGWFREEKRFYNLFFSAYGDSPLCNHMSPKMASTS
jgi:RNA polymerase sigma-54 factor